MNTVAHGPVCRTPLGGLLHGVVRVQPVVILRALCKSVALQAAGSDDVCHARRREVLFENGTRSVLYRCPTAAEVIGARPEAVCLSRNLFRSCRFIFFNKKNNLI